jgi:DNA mismatch repair ATPase MutL
LQSNLEQVFTPARGFTVTPIKSFGAFQKEQNDHEELESAPLVSKGSLVEKITPDSIERPVAHNDSCCSSVIRSIDLKDAPNSSESSLLLSKSSREDIENTPPAAVLDSQAQWKALFSAPIGGKMDAKPLETKAVKPRDNGALTAIANKTIQKAPKLLSLTTHASQVGKSNNFNQTDERLLVDIRQDMKAFFSMNLVRGNYRLRNRQETIRRCHSDSMDIDSTSSKFKAGIGPDKADLAIEEFNRMIMKEDFSKMEILGQFNLGFIIARLKDDLFIIDQHAR